MCFGFDLSSMSTTRVCFYVKGFVFDAKGLVHFFAFLCEGICFDVRNLCLM